MLYIKTNKTHFRAFFIVVLIIGTFFLVLLPFFQLFIVLSCKCFVVCSGDGVQPHPGGVTLQDAAGPITIHILGLNKLGDHLTPAGVLLCFSWLLSNSLYFLCFLMC